jgi:hypothetical protein
MQYYPCIRILPRPAKAVYSFLGSRFLKIFNAPVLKVQVIPANSPQAKGRVERNHGLKLNRLVKELRLAGISTIPEANRFLEETCLPKTNGKFSRPAAPGLLPGFLLKIL